MSGQTYTRWFTEYPSTHERAGQTVEVEVVEVGGERAPSISGPADWEQEARDLGVELHLMTRDRDAVAEEVERLREALEDARDRLTELWHAGASQPGQELHDFLGMTWEEYAAWANPSASGPPGGEGTDA